MNNRSTAAAEEILHVFPHPLRSPPSERVFLPSKQGTSLLREKPEDAPSVPVNGAFASAGLLCTCRCSHPLQGKQNDSLLDQAESKTCSSLQQLAGSQEEQPEVHPASPHPLSYAPRAPLPHTVRARDRDTSLPACRTPLHGWSHAECTRYSSCCPQGVSPGNRIWASESTRLQWLFVSPSWAP